MAEVPTRKYINFKVKLLIYKSLVNLSVKEKKKPNNKKTQHLRALAALLKYPGSILSTLVVAHNYLLFQSQGIQDTHLVHTRAGKIAIHTKFF